MTTAFDDDEYISLSRNALFRAMRLLPSEDERGKFALRLIGFDDSGESMKNEHDVDPQEPWSAPLTVEQARQLVAKIDKKTVEVIKAALTNLKGGVATVEWDTVKDITGVTNWSEFARGRLAGLHRSVSSIVSEPRSILMWEYDEWVEDGQGDYSTGSLAIDGTAVRSLQTALSIYNSDR